MSTQKGMSSTKPKGGAKSGNSARSDLRRRLNARAGLEGQTRGQSWQLALFADNVLNTDYAATRASFNSYGANNALAPTQFVRLNDPRTIGIRLTVRGGATERVRR